MSETGKPMFSSDYQEGCHPAILQRLNEHNFTPTSGYGEDPISDCAKAKIREAIGCPGAHVQFVIGGTQANALVIANLLRPYESVISPDTGHINGHESGAVEASGHKILTLKSKDGKITAEAIDAFMSRFLLDDAREHMTQPGLVYISLPTESGTLYSLDELVSIREVTKKYELKLFVDGARLAYALGTKGNTVTLKDLSRNADAFYIGGTKCGALFGEAVVFPDPANAKHFFALTKQRGALLAKGWLLGLQFDALFTDGLYESIGVKAVALADRIRRTLADRGYSLVFGSPTNQLFVCLEDDVYRRISEAAVVTYWGKPDECHTIARICTSWATTEEAVEALLKLF